MVIYYCGSLIRYADIPHALWEDVDACIAAGDEILAGNDGFGHRVYGRCKSRQYENASVYKIDPKRVDPMSKAFIKFLSQEEPVKKCDRMVAVWDGESQEVLMDVLLLLALQKKCRMYYLPTDSCVEITSVDELEPLVPDREGWTPKFMRKVFKTCGFGKEMIEYTVANGVLSDREMTEIVCRAPIPLTKKHKLLDELIRKNNVNYELFVKCAEAIRAGNSSEVREAVKGVFGLWGDDLYDAANECTLAKMGLKHYTYYLFDEWYDTDVLIEKSYPCGLFGTLKQVKDYIRKEMELEQEDMEEGDEPYPSWYRIEAWNLDVWDKYEHAYNYYVYNGEICWFERIELRREKKGYEHYIHADERFCGGFFDMNITTPFKAGDIVSVDCRPFGTPFRALVVEGRDQYDCCLPTILFKVPYTDKWMITALKHKRFYKDVECGSYEPKLSPLYRLRSVGEDELTEEDELLVKVSEWIAGDEERGAAFWNAWHECPGDERTFEGALEVLEKVKGTESP